MDEQASKDCKETPTHEKAGFDRLKPRHSTERKRKLSPSQSSDHQNEEGNDSKIRKTEFKREYSKLKNLVPALNERSDITKVEIIEETIRYIDALHHQLAARLHSQNVNSASDEPHNESKREGKPLRQLDSSLIARDEADNLTSANQSSILSLSPPTNHDSLRLGQSSSSSVTSSRHNMNHPESSSCSSQETSIKDLKAAVENIQELFSIHLMEQQQNDGDET